MHAWKLVGKSCVWGMRVALHAWGVCMHAWKLVRKSCVWGRWVALHAWGAMRACMHGSVVGNLKPGIETACVGEVGCNACVGWPEREGRS